MATGVTSPSGGDLKQLRQQYDRLCDLMTRTAESDPAGAERLLKDLETLSERILALESGDTAGPLTSEAAGAPASVAPAPLPAAAAPADRVETGRAPRIVSFRVTPVTNEAVPPAPAPKSSWRIDGPPAAPATPLPTVDPKPPAEPQSQPATDPAEPAALVSSAPAATGPGNATLFSTAIRQWLERHRQADVIADAAVTRPPPDQADPPAPTGAPADGDRPPPAPEFAHMAAAIEQQAAQIERIMELCEDHQAALERLQAQIEERLRLPDPLPAREVDAGPAVAELRLVVEEQRQRITTLAKTIHNLAQWLAAQHAAPDR
jgi:hypothetical protein